MQGRNRDRGIENGLLDTVREGKAGGAEKVALTCVPCHV